MDQDHEPSEPARKRIKVEIDDHDMAAPSASTDPIIPPTPETPHSTSSPSGGRRTSEPPEIESHAMPAVTSDPLVNQGEERRVSEQFNDPEADLEFITEDGVILRMHAYVLRTHSLILREKYRTPPEPLQTCFETHPSYLVEDLFSIMVGLPWSLSHLPADRLRRLIKLSILYDCPTVREHIKAKIYQSLGQPDTSPMSLFVGAVTLDCPETCRRIIPYAGKRQWSKMSNKDNLDDGIPEACTLDITAMPIFHLESLPPRYIAALGRSMRSKKRGRDGKVDWKKVADEFYRLLTSQN